MSVRTERSSGACHRDKAGWLQQTADLISHARFDQIDAPRLAEYLSHMAQWDRRELLARLTILMTHLLKVQYVPNGPVKRWRRTIHNHRFQLEMMIEAPSLQRHALKVLDKAYRKAVKRAAEETSLPVQKFPTKCPWSLEQLLVDQPAW